MALQTQKFTYGITELPDPSGNIGNFLTVGNDGIPDWTGIDPGNNNFISNSVKVSADNKFELPTLTVSTTGENVFTIYRDASSSNITATIFADYDNNNTLMGKDGWMSAKDEDDWSSLSVRSFAGDLNWYFVAGVGEWEPLTAGYNDPGISNTYQITKALAGGDDRGSAIINQYSNEGYFDIEYVPINSTSNHGNSLKGYVFASLDYKTVATGSFEKNNFTYTGNTNTDLSAEFTYSLSDLGGTGYNQSYVRGIYLDTTQVHVNYSYNSDATILVQYPDNTWQSISQSSTNNTIDDYYQRYINKKVTLVPINQGQTNLKIRMFVNSDQNITSDEIDNLTFPGSPECCRYKIVGAQQARQLNISPEVDTNFMKCQVDTSNGYFDANTIVSKNGSYRYTDNDYKVDYVDNFGLNGHTHTIDGDGDTPLGNFFPYKPDLNVNKTEIEYKMMAHDNSGSSERGYVKVWIDWINKTYNFIFSLSNVDHAGRYILENEDISFNTGSKIIGATKYTTSDIVNRSSYWDSTMQIEIDNNGIKKLPVWKHYNGNETAAIIMSIKNYKSLISTELSAYTYSTSGVQMFGDSGIYTQFGSNSTTGYIEFPIKYDDTCYSVNITPSGDFYEQYLGQVSINGFAVSGENGGFHWQSIGK